MKTEAYFLMRAAERFGMDPFAWPDSLSSGKRAQALAFELVREDEEERMAAPRH